MSTLEFKKKALLSLRGNWVIASLVGFIVAIMGGNIFAEIPWPNQKVSVRELEMITTFLKDNNVDSSIIAIVVLLLSIQYGVVIFRFIFSGPFNLGSCRYSINLVEKEQNASIKDVFLGMKSFLKAFLTLFLVDIFITLWMLLLIIPGLIAFYSYRMTFFILADREYYSATDAITESKVMMDGYKWELFILDLSFIGWNILILATLGVAGIWIVPYKKAAEAAFYLKLKNKMA